MFDTDKVISKVPGCVLQLIEKIQEQVTSEVYLVGGAVRDILLERQPFDWDIVTDHPCSAIVPTLEDMEMIYRLGLTGQKADLITCYDYDSTVEQLISIHITSMQYTTTGSIHEDLHHRDFTINSIAWNPTLGIIDEVGGISDLEQEYLVFTDSLQERCREDPSRIVRAIAMFRHGYRLSSTDIEEVLQLPEVHYMQSQPAWMQYLLNSLMSCDQLVDAIDYYTELVCTLYPILAPMRECQQNPISQMSTAWNHTLHALEILQNYGFHDPVVRWACLFHDCGKPSIDTVKGKPISFPHHEVVGANYALSALAPNNFADSRVPAICQLILYHTYELNEETTGLESLISILGEAQTERWFQLRFADIMAHAPIVIARHLNKHIAMWEWFRKYCSHPYDSFAMI